MLKVNSSHNGHLCIAHLYTEARTLQHPLNSTKNDPECQVLLTLLYPCLCMSITEVFKVSARCFSSESLNLNSHCGLKLSALHHYAENTKMRQISM